jgi:ABC-type antimicrobial peptide transport system permease subunit
VDKAVSPRRFTVLLLGGFAGIALILASLGIYGVISYSVSQRTQEIGIRMALGADKSQVFRMIVVQGIGMAGAGLGIGTLAAIALVRVLPSFSHLLYSVGRSDPLTLFCVSAALLVVALAACFLPASRAMRTDPMRALRTE